MATLSGNKIKNTYQSLVKFSDNGNITVGAKQLTDGFGNNSPMFVSTTQVGIGVTPESGIEFHVYGDAKIGSNLTVIGNLVVEGSTTTVGTDTLTVKDPLIVLANNNTSTDAVDIGFYGKYHPSGTTLYSGLFREALTGKYRLFKGLEVEPTTTVNTSGTGYAQATLIASLEGNVTGNLTGNVTGGTISGTTGTFSGNVDIDGTLDVDDVISVEGSAFGRIEIGGASGGYIDLKAPNSDDYDLRIITSSGGNEVTTATGDLIFNTAETLALTIDTSQDATFEGNIVVSGTVDGRDVATDGAKLDGIESGATADQTAAEIKTAYESNANTNAFTDADETKLNGIEASADVTDATNVLAAGAVMTTGNQSIGGVKTFSDQVTIPATPSASTDAASKGYVDAAVEGQDTLAEILAIGNTTGGTDIAITSGDKITNFTSTGIDDNASSEVIHITSGGKIGIDEDTPLAKLTVNQDSLVDTEGIMVQSGNDAGNGGVAIFKSANLVGSISALGSSSSLTFMTSGGTTALTLDSSQNATFAGSVTITPTNNVNLLVNDSGTELELISGTNGGTYGVVSNHKAHSFKFLTDGGSGTFTDKLTLDSSGNVGIGTDSPDTKLEVVKDVDNSTNTGTDGNATQILHNGNASGTAVLKLRGTGSNSGAIVFGGGLGASTDKFNIISRYNNTKILTAVADGNVGIGEDNPQENLHITATTPVFRLEGGSHSYQQYVSGTSFYIRDVTNSSNRIVLDSSGNVGIGQTSLSSTRRLHISGTQAYDTASGGNGTGGIYIKGGTAGDNNYSSGIGFSIATGTSGISGVQTDGSDADRMGLAFFTHGSGAGTATSSEAMRIESNGNVGIGTTSPSNKLSVCDSNGTGLEIAPNDSNAQVVLLAYDRADSAYREMNFNASNYIWRTSATERMRIDSSGGVSITPTTSTSLFYGADGTNSYINFETNNIDATVQLYAGYSSGGYFAIGTKDSGGTLAERMRITSTGNVGIGTTDIDFELQVGGTDLSVTANFNAQFAVLSEATTGYPSGFIFKAPRVATSSNRVLLNEDFGTYFSTQVYATSNASAQSDIPIVFAPLGGNVGIGETNPTKKIDVYQSSTSFGAADFRHVNGNRILINPSYNYYDAYNHIFRGLNGTDTHLTIDSSGNIMMGKTSQSGNAALTVKSTAGGNTGIILVEGDTTNDGWGVYAVTANEYRITRFTNGSYSDKFIIDSSGNVGIGSDSPDEKLDVQGNILVGDYFKLGSSATYMGQLGLNRNVSTGAIYNSSYGAYQIQNYLGDLEFQIYNSSGNDVCTHRFFGSGDVFFDGDVGIKDTSPSYELDVDGTIRATGDVIAYSDKRVKENIKTIDNALNKVDKLRGVEFNKIGEDKKSIGVIAQEIEKVIPEVVREDDKGMKSVAYGNITGVLIEAIKELKSEIEVLKNKPCVCDNCNCK